MAGVDQEVRFDRHEYGRHREYERTTLAHPVVPDASRGGWRRDLVPTCGIWLSHCLDVGIVEGNADANDIGRYVFSIDMREILERCERERR